jgi:hypothetical protein
MARRPYKGRGGYGRTTALGYGNTHQRLRERWAKVVDAGGVLCGRCGRLIDPATPWDLSHPGDDKTLDPVPWHQRCNRQYAASVTKPRRRVEPSTTPQPQNIKRPPGWRSPTGQPWSRDWGGGHWGEE